MRSLFGCRGPFKCLALLILWAAFSDSHTLRVLAFDFTYSPPTQCDNLNVSWSGGRGPFSLLITPPFFPSLNISIPESAFDENAGKGIFSTQLTLPAGRKFLITMSDADGFGTGGISDVLTTGSSLSGANCNTTHVPDFTFQANSALQQCNPFPFYGFNNGSVGPITIYGFIPLGQLFIVASQSGQSTVTWPVNLAAGTSVVFVMVDSAGRQGGSTDLLTVSNSNDASCINGSSPHSTASASATNAPHATESVRAVAGPNTGEIAGAVIGGLAFIALVILLAFLCLRRKREKSNPLSESRPTAEPAFINNGGTSRVSRVRTSFIPSGRRRTQPSVDLLPSGVRPLPSVARPTMVSIPYYPSSSSLPPRSEYEPSPFVFPSDASAADGHSGQFPEEVYDRDSHSTGLYTYGAHSRSQSRSQSDTDAPLSPESALLNPFSQGHNRRPSVPFSVDSSAPASRKASLVGTIRTTPRFILHTDAEDLSTVDDSEELVELPPQYTDRRPPSPASSLDMEKRRSVP